MESKQELEISIKREQYVAFWVNTVTILNRAAAQKRKIVFCDEKKLTENDVREILKRFGLDILCISLEDWQDSSKWDFSSYETPNRKRIKSLTIKEDGSVKPIASCKVRKQDGHNVGYIQVLCGFSVRNYQDILPFESFGTMDPEKWTAGFNAWANSLPTFKSVDGYNSWMDKYCEIGSLVSKIKYYYDGLVKGDCSLCDSDTEQQVLGLKTSLSYDLGIYNKEKEKNYTKYPNFYDRCDYYISELSKDPDKVMEFFGEYEEKSHPAFDEEPHEDSIWDVLRTYEAYYRAKKEAPKYYTEEYIAEHFRL